tara:strand:- start:5645 stop:6778 length:1134 start_codon:yes stop_codon:yes gene_type:complete
LKLLLNAGTFWTQLIVINLIFLSFFTLPSCKDKPPKVVQSDSILSPTPIDVRPPFGFPPVPVPSDNPFTKEGLFLGRKLFYDPILSGDNSQSCASCHKQSSSFVDENMKFSFGIDGSKGIRNSMPLYNLAYAKRLFWNGAATSLEDLISEPITNPIEMHESWMNTLDELQAHEEYPLLFQRAFGEKGIDSVKVVKSIAQFLRSIFAFDLATHPDTTFSKRAMTPQQIRGLRVYVDEEKGDCFHCHSVSLLNTNYEFMSNGLVENPAQDPGLFEITGRPQDIGRFKVPSLLNIKYTSPYMHDGRFETLEEVLAFYDTGFHYYPDYPNLLDPNLKKHLDPQTMEPVSRKWTKQDKEDLIAFLNGLEDSDLLSNPIYSQP